MADAPERIWATEDADNFGEDRFHTRHGPMKGLIEYVRADLTPPAVVIEAMEQALRFYDKSWNATPNKRYGGLEWKPREALLDDCGNCAKSAIADLDKWRAGK